MSTEASMSTDGCSVPHGKRRHTTVEDHPDTLSFVVAIDDQIGAPAAWQFNDTAALTAWRRYVTAVVRQRLHQRGFRQRARSPGLSRPAHPSAARRPPQPIATSWTRSTICSG